MEEYKKYLMAIKYLDLSDTLEKMDFEEYTALKKKLLDFTRVFPNYESAMSKSFSAKEYGKFAEDLICVQELLRSINAKGLELSCRRLLDELNGQEYSIAEAHLLYLFTEISALIIDIKTILTGGYVFEALKTSPGYEYPTKSILAVIDTSLLLLGLKVILQKIDCSFIGITSCDAALKYVENNTPNLFLLDWNMKQMGGYDLAKKLQERGQKAPIIFLFDHFTPEELNKIMEFGAVDFIVMPIKESHVLEKVKKYISY